MAICGFNKKIGEGLNLLVNGMIDALNEKTVQSTPEDVLATELVELDSIISVLRGAPGEVLPEMFIGLNLLAKALFVQVRHDLEASEGVDLGNACREVGERFIDLLAQTEQKNIELRLQFKNRNDFPAAVSERACELAQWALKRSSDLSACAGK